MASPLKGEPKQIAEIVSDQFFQALIEKSANALILMDIDGNILAADTALYNAKVSGRDQIKSAS